MEENAGKKKPVDVNRLLFAAQAANEQGQNFKTRAEKEFEIANTFVERAREAILAGKSTGDLVRDFGIVVERRDNSKTQQELQKMVDKLSGHEAGAPILVVQNGIEVVERLKFGSPCGGKTLEKREVIKMYVGSLKSSTPLLDHDRGICTIETAACLSMEVSEEMVYESDVLCNVTVEINFPHYQYDPILDHTIKTPHSPQYTSAAVYVGVESIREYLLFESTRRHVLCYEVLFHHQSVSQVSSIKDLPRPPSFVN